MTQKELNKRLKKHYKWLNSDGKKGEQLDLFGEDLQGLSFVDTNLSYAILGNCDLRNADFTRATLKGTNLRFANLEGSCLEGTCLCSADLYGANIKATSIRLDSGLKVMRDTRLNIDDNQAIEILYHLVANVKFSDNTSPAMKRLFNMKSIINMANKYQGPIEFMSDEEE